MLLILVFRKAFTFIGFYILNFEADHFDSQEDLERQRVSWTEGSRLRCGSLSCSYLAMWPWAQRCHITEGEVLTLRQARLSSSVAFSLRLWTEWVLRGVSFGGQGSRAVRMAEMEPENFALRLGLSTRSDFFCVLVMPPLSSLGVVNISALPIVFFFLSWLQRSSELNLWLDIVAGLAKLLNMYFFFIWCDFFFLLVLLFLGPFLHYHLKSFWEVGQVCTEKSFLREEDHQTNGKQIWVTLVNVWDRSCL